MFSFGIHSMCSPITTLFSSRSTDHAIARTATSTMVRPHVRQPILTGHSFGQSLHQIRPVISTSHNSPKKRRSRKPAGRETEFLKLIMMVFRKLLQPQKAVIVYFEPFNVGSHDA